MIRSKSITKRVPAIRKPVRRKHAVVPKQHGTERPLAWLDEFHSKVPPNAWDAVPTDGARNLDHYLYGAPKHRN